MSAWLTGALAGAAGLVLGAIAYWFRLRIVGQTLAERSERLIAEARAERERVLKAAQLQAKEEALALQREQEEEVRRAQQEIGAEQKRLRQRETNLDRKTDQLDTRERELRKREAEAAEQARETRETLEEARQRLQSADAELERIAGLSRDEAHKQLVRAIEGQAREQAASRVQKIQEEAREQAREEATKIIASSIQRLAGAFVSEKTVSVVELPSDDMKGRIIGREGRNIRAIEAATGVDVIIDDTPEVVVLSAFNPVRREIAREALQRLVSDGRIHPARIEEVVEKVTEEMQETIQRHGEQATFDLGLHGLHAELATHVGKLKYRTVNGQNLWNHAVETAHIAGVLAAELGENTQLAKRAGLLHDIGKAVDHEVEGHHAEVAAELARRLGERDVVVEAIRHHHADEPPTVLATILQAADTLSKARPGARRDAIESYIRRLEHLERIAGAFDGVEQAFVVQSGREVRVIVGFDRISDQQALVLAGDIARRIEEELTYPGEVKVTVIREARATEIAR